MNIPPRAGQLREFASLARDRWMFDAGPVVLMYHKIARPPAGTNLPFLYVHPRRFERQMDEFMAAGARCVPCGDLLPTAPAGTARADVEYCVTFDDGFRNVFEHALPVLRQRGLCSIQFLVGSLIGREDAWDRAIGEPPQALMDDARIRDWLAGGQEIGAHTLTHPHLTRISPAEARSEIFDSKKLLEDRFGREIKHFCYPYGDNNPMVRDLVAEAGYVSALTVEFGAVGSGDPAHGLPRVMATDLPPLWRVAAKKLWHTMRRSG